MSRTKTSSNRSKDPFSSTNHSGGYHKGSLTASTHRSRQLPKLIYRVMQRSSPPFRNAGEKPPSLSLKVPSISLELTHQCSHLRLGTRTWAGQQSCFLFPPQWSAHRRPTNQERPTSRCCEARLTVGLPLVTHHLDAREGSGWAAGRTGRGTSQVVPTQRRLCVPKDTHVQPSPGGR